MEGNQLQRVPGNTHPTFWTAQRIRALELDNLARRARNQLKDAGATLLVEERNSFGFPVMTIRAEPTVIQSIRERANQLRHERRHPIPRIVARLFGVDIQWEEV